MRPWVQDRREEGHVLYLHPVSQRAPILGIQCGEQAYVLDTGQKKRKVYPVLSNKASQHAPILDVQGVSKHTECRTGECTLYTHLLDWPAFTCPGYMGLMTGDENGTTSVCPSGRSNEYDVS